MALKSHNEGGEDAGSVRVNVGLTRECLEKIDELTENFNLFNSRSEFVIAALRNLYLDYIRVARISFKNAMENSEDEREAFNRYYDGMEEIGRGLERRYRDQFGAAINIQIAMRLNQGFYKNLTSLDDLSPRGIQPLCRMAIVQYCEFIEDEIENYNEFIDQFNERVDCVNGEDLQEDEDPMEIWDKLTKKRDPDSESQD